ncbi:hypothetical protein ACWCOW_35275 [Streptomyces sp. NPDC001939]
MRDQLEGEEPESFLSVVTEGEGDVECLIDGSPCGIRVALFESQLGCDPQEVVFTSSVAQISLRGQRLVDD